MTDRTTSEHLEAAEAATGADARAGLLRRLLGVRLAGAPSTYRRDLAVLAGSGLLKSSSRWVAVGCWTETACALVLMVTPNGLDTVGGRVIGAVVAALGILIGLLWWRRGWPRERVSLVFAVCSDLAHTALLLGCSDPVVALLASLWFFLVGDYLVFAHRHPAVAVHTGWVGANLLFFGLRSILQTDSDPAFVVFLLLSMGGALVVIPMFAQRFADALRTTSRRSVELASRDPLTRLLNRRGLADAAPRLFSQVRRERATLGALVLDIDSFKRVNDDHGHHSGDAVLGLLAARLQGAVRRHGLVARFGGEEFVVLDRIPPDGIAPLADRLLAVCRDGDDEVPITVSIGAVGLHPDSFPSDDPVVLLDAVVKRADAAMYRAKQRGGNQVTIDGDPPDTPGPRFDQSMVTDPAVHRMQRSARQIFDDVVARRADSDPRHTA